MVSTLNFNLALASLPTLQLFAAPPADALALVKSILEEFYTDGIDQIVSAQLDDKGDISGEFIDQVGARQVKRYQYRIQDSEVAFKLLNPNEVQNFSFESFKPLFGKGSRAGKKKNCRNSTPCGDSCIESSKTCRKKPGSAVKAKIAEAKQKLEGALATTPQKPKPPKELPPLGTSARAQAIDEKYAGKNPTDEQAASWLKERIENEVFPTEESILNETVSFARMHPTFDYFDEVSNKYTATIVDRESFAQAAYAYEQMRPKKAKFKNDPDDDTSPAYWEKALWNDADEAKLNSAQKRQTSGKTEESRKKAAQEYKEFQVQKKSVKADAKDMAAHTKKTKEKPKEQRLQDFRADFDDEYKRAAVRIKKTARDIKNGNKSATAKATQKLKTRLGIEESVYKPYAGMSDKEIAKSLLQDGYQPNTRTKLDDIPAAKLYLREVAGYSPDIPQGWDLNKGFTSGDIKKQYRALALIHHPDAGGSPEKFRALTTEYERLMAIANRRKN